MSIKKNPLLIITVTALAFAFMGSLLLANAQSPQAKTERPWAGKPQAPLLVQIEKQDSFENGHHLRLKGLVKLKTFSIKNISYSWELPEGVRLLSASAKGTTAINPKDIFETTVDIYVENLDINHQILLKVDFENSKQGKALGIYLTRPELSLEHQAAKKKDRNTDGNIKALEAQEPLINRIRY